MAETTLITNMTLAICCPVLITAVACPVLMANNNGHYDT
jgi:hypothetical protein